MNNQEIRRRLNKATVGIAGCGGLGSNCAVALARTGVGNLVLADFDVVDASNLNRQYFFSDQIGMKKVIALRDNILRVEKNVEIQAWDLKLKSDNISAIFRNCDVIVEAFDSDEMKALIIETVLSEMPAKFIVSGHGLAGWGQTDHLKIVRDGNLIICGDGITEVSENLPPLAPRVGIVANMQANEVLRILLDDIYNENNTK